MSPLFVPCWLVAPICPGWGCGEPGFHPTVEGCLTALRIAVRIARQARPDRAIGYASAQSRIRQRKAKQYIPAWH